VVVDESPGLWVLIGWQCVCVCVFEVDSFGMDSVGSGQCVYEISVYVGYWPCGVCIVYWPNGQ
jgi:hypothetical protein